LPRSPGRSPVVSAMLCTVGLARFSRPRAIFANHAIDGHPGLAGCAGVLGRRSGLDARFGLERGIAGGTLVHLRCVTSGCLAAIAWLIALVTRGIRLNGPGIGTMLTRLLCPKPRRRCQGKNPDHGAECGGARVNTHVGVSLLSTL